MPMLTAGRIRPASLLPRRSRLAFSSGVHFLRIAAVSFLISFRLGSRCDGLSGLGPRSIFRAMLRTVVSASLKCFAISDTLATVQFDWRYVKSSDASFGVRSSRFLMYLILASRSTNQPPEKRKDHVFVLSRVAHRRLAYPTKRRRDHRRGRLRCELLHPVNFSIAANDASDSDAGISPRQNVGTMTRRVQPTADDRRGVRLAHRDVLSRA